MTLRLLTVATVFSLFSACAGSQQPTPIHGVTPGHKCLLAATQQFIGELGTSDSGAAILRASGAAVLRWAPPDTMLTMDFRSDRATVYLDRQDKITKIDCL